VQSQGEQELHNKFEMVEQTMGKDAHRRFEQLAEKLLASLVFCQPDHQLH
jgi:hypothetical protein